MECNVPLSGSASVLRMHVKRRHGDRETCGGDNRWTGRAHVLKCKVDNCRKRVRSGAEDIFAYVEKRTPCTAHQCSNCGKIFKKPSAANRVHKYGDGVERSHLDWCNGRRATTKRIRVYRSKCGRWVEADQWEGIDEGFSE